MSVKQLGHFEQILNNFSLLWIQCYHKRCLLFYDTIPIHQTWLQSFK